MSTTFGHARDSASGVRTAASRSLVWQKACSNAAMQRYIGPYVTGRLPFACGLLRPWKMEKPAGCCFFGGEQPEASSLLSASGRVQGRRECSETAAHGLRARLAQPDVRRGLMAMRCDAMKLDAL